MVVFQHLSNEIKINKCVGSLAVAQNCVVSPVLPEVMWDETRQRSPPAEF